MKTIKPRAFRPWPENEERLEFADKLGLNVSELINEILKESKALKEKLERRQAELRKFVAAPIP